MRGHSMFENREISIASGREGTVRADGEGLWRSLGEQALSLRAKRSNLKFHGSRLLRRSASRNDNASSPGTGTAEAMGNASGGRKRHAGTSLGAVGKSTVPPTPTKEDSRLGNEPDCS